MLLFLSCAVLYQKKAFFDVDALVCLLYRKNNSKCLVHCKMGVSRSASTVIAYAMKEYGWSLEKANNFVKQKRNIAQPNPAFMKQLAEYEGILDARWEKPRYLDACSF